MSTTSNRSSDYTINKTVFRVCYGDITRLTADVLVSSDDNYLTMGGGVSMAIASAGGDEIRLEVQKHVPLSAGAVAVTSAGKLTARYVFHAVTIDFDTNTFPNEEIICNATKRCLQIADTLGVRIIAFPALGTGVGGFSFQLAADCMTRTISDYLMENSRLELVILTLFARERVTISELDIFYERSVALASVSAQSKKFGQVLDDLYKIVQTMQQPKLTQRVLEFREELRQAQLRLAEAPINSTQIQIETVQDNSQIATISKEVVQFSTEVKTTLDWDYRQFAGQVIRTKLHGLYAQLNIQQSHLNKLLIEKAKYGGVGVPPRLEFAIDELSTELSTLESQLKQTNQELVALNVA